MTTFRDLFVEHLGAALERQLELGDKIGPCDWHLDLPGGTISFDMPERPLVVPIQVLGSEADAAATWIAAWSLNPARMPEPLAEVSRRLRAIGEKGKIPELVNGRVPLDEIDGERFSLVASGLLAAPGYYRAPFSGGAMFLLLRDPSLVTAVASGARAARILEVFRRAADLLTPAEHRPALEAYVRHHGGKVASASSAAGTFRAEWKGETLTAKVDADGRIHSLDAT